MDQFKSCHKLKKHCDFLIDTVSHRGYTVPIFMALLKMNKYTDHKITKTLRDYNYDIDSLKHKKVIQHIINQAELQNRKKLTRAFIANTMAEFSKTNPAISIQMHEVKRPQRIGVDYKVDSQVHRSDKPSKIGKKRNLLAMLAKKVTTPLKYAVTPEDENIDHALVDRLRDKAPSLQILSPKRLVLSPNRTTAKGPNETPYRPCMKGSSGILWRQYQEPEKIIFNEQNIPTKNEIEKKFPKLDSKPEFFEFIVTKETIESRLHTKRECTQKQVTGYSAKEFFQEMGVTIKEAVRGSHYHLAHRHGYGLGGDQEYGNLDPATAGSNYMTLFFIENPISELLQNHPGEAIDVKVRGDIAWNELVPIPKEIKYTLQWGNGRTIEKNIFPLEYDAPAVSDNQISKIFVQEQYTPPRVSEVGMFKLSKTQDISLPNLPVDKITSPEGKLILDNSSQNKQSICRKLFN